MSNNCPIICPKLETNTYYCNAYHELAIIRLDWLSVGFIICDGDNSGVLSWKTQSDKLK